MSKPSIKSMKQAIAEEQNYLAKIRSGEISPIKTNYNFVNYSMLNGLHQSDIITVAGASGGGKTTFVGELQEGICRLNSNVKVLDFTFEYLARKKVTRFAAKKYKRTMKNIYTKDTDIPDFEWLKAYPIYFVENPCTVARMAEIIDGFCNKFHNYVTFVCIDHSLLLKRSSGDSERDSLIALANGINQMKKQYPIISCIVSQLNDGIDDPVRTSQPSGQYPRKSDIFGGRALFHVSDLMTVLMNPIKMNLKTKTYGVHQLPLNWPNTQGGSSYPLIYAHNIKARDGNETITPLINNLKNYNLMELDKKRLEAFYNKYF